MGFDKLALSEASDANARGKVITDLLTDNIGSYAHMLSGTKNWAVNSTVGAYTHFPSGTYPVKTSSGNTVGVLGNIFGIDVISSGVGNTTVNKGVWYPLGSVTNDYFIFSTNFSVLPDALSRGRTKFSYDLGIGSPTPSAFLTRSAQFQPGESDIVASNVNSLSSDSFDLKYPIEFDANDLLWARSSNQATNLSGTVSVHYMVK